GEYADKGDVLLSIREKDAMVKIKSFFKTRDFGAIQKGKEVTVKFPDKTKSRGVIEKVYSSLYRNTGNLRSPAVIPPEIVVEVIPKDPASSTLWERYDQLEVAIEVRK
ncbi:MAG: HlyD family efflux transporter periplasmic adaptor subunit, partial [Nitrospinota bacterium]